MSSVKIPSLICPISITLMTDPVMDTHDHCFQKTGLQEKKICPLNNKPLEIEDFKENEIYHTLKMAIDNRSRSGQGAVRTGLDGLFLDPNFFNVEEIKGIEEIVQMDNVTVQQDGPLAKLNYAIEKQRELLKKSNTEKNKETLAQLLMKKGGSEEASSIFVELARPAFEINNNQRAIVLIQQAMIPYPVVEILKKKSGPNPIPKGEMASLFAKLSEQISVNKDKTLKKLKILLKEMAAAFFVELAQQSLYGSDNLKATNFIQQALTVYPGCAEAWKTKAALQPNDEEKIKVLLQGASETSMPYKQRKILCKMALNKLPDHSVANRLLFMITYPNGKGQLEKYLDSVDCADLLPPEMEEVLQSPCPLDPEKKTHETHLLQLMVPEIGDSPFTLDLLRELAKHPKTGEGVWLVDIMDIIKKFLGKLTPIKAPYWLLMPKNPLPGSQGLRCPDQIKFAAEWIKK